MERTFLVTITAETDENLTFIKHDIEQELGCACAHFYVESVKEVELAVLKPAAEVTEDAKIRRVISALRYDPPSGNPAARAAYLTALLDVEIALIGGKNDG